MAQRDKRGETFADIVQKAHEEPRASPRDGAARDRVNGRDAWDPSGLHWLDSGRKLTRAEVEELLADLDVPVGLQEYHFSREIKWYAGVDRHLVWQRDVAPRFVDAERPDWAAGYPEHVPLVAKLYTRPGGRRLLWFQGEC